MNGFSQDIISILKHNVMHHSSSLGLILGATDIEEAFTALRQLHLNGLLVESKLNDFVRFDYIVIPKQLLNVRKFLSCLTRLASGGIMVLEITGSEDKYEDKYLNMVGGTMSGTKVRYQDRSYIVIHTGEDYGD